MICFLFFHPERMFLGLEQLKESRGRSVGQDLLAMLYMLFKFLFQTRSSQMATEMVRRNILKTKHKCIACCSYPTGNHAVKVRAVY